MPFVIYEQGRRIQTPLASVFPPRTVEQLTPTEKPPRISEDDQIKESRLAHNERSLGVYQQIDDGSAKREKVRYANEIMTSPLLTVNEQESVEQAWKIIRSHGFHHLPVLGEEQKLVGILSDRDILTALAVSSTAETATVTAAIMANTVSSLMQKRVLSATANTEVRLIAGLMAENQIGAIPVVDNEDHVEGIVTRTDILRILVNQAPLELWT